jgi:ABC-type antimicrobial peptide transport system permease subunit
MKTLDRIMASWKIRHKRMRCLTGIIFFAGLVIGLFVTTWICEIVVITLMHPPDGYFMQGLRYDDPHGRWLTNGEPVPLLFRLLHLPLYVILIFLWYINSLFVITAIADWISPRRPKQ